MHCDDHPTVANPQLSRPVIASEAKQSMAPQKRNMDCFASLAMMGWTAPDGIDVPDW